MTARGLLGVLESRKDVPGDAVIVNVASGLGSFGVVTDTSRFESNIPTLAYGSSKSAVTMITHHSGPRTVEQGTDAIVRLATIGQEGPPTRQPLS
jgi:NAD(P)-dependent dehydrogenase (short-subunit alcohol dehydrogenase family)